MVRLRTHGLFIIGWKCFAICYNASSYIRYVVMQRFSPVHVSCSLIVINTKYTIQSLYLNENEIGL